MSVQSKTIFDNFTAKEIEASYQRMMSLTLNEEATLKEKEIHSIKVNNDVVGCWAVNEKTISVTFRGSIGRLQEIVKIGWSQISNLEDKGKIHKNIYQNALKFREQLIKEITAFDFEAIHIEGYSQGSMYAVVTALFFKDAGFFDKLKVITFAQISLLDEQATVFYNKAFTGKHVSFLAEEDQVTQKATSLIKALNHTSLPGTLISFSAHKESTFSKRVQSQRWTMLAPIAVLGVSIAFNKQQWEAHMPFTYIAGIEAFKEHQSKYKS